MPVFTAHAYLRFLNRRPDLADVPPERHRWEALAHESFMKGKEITREEAEARIRARIRPKPGAVYYRTDGTGPGVWVTRWSKNRQLVVTYLAPKCVRRRRRCGWIGFQRARLWPVVNEKKPERNVLWHIK